MQHAERLCDKVVLLARGQKAFEGTVTEARATSRRFLELEGAIDPAAAAALPGVTGVHDLHVWALSTTETALTAHLVHDRTDGDTLLREAQAVARRHAIRHTTLQLENEPLPDCPGC